MERDALDVMRTISLKDVRRQIQRSFGWMHVRTPIDEVADHAISMFGGKKVWEALSPSRRKALAKVVGGEWARVVKEYTSVMRTGLLVSEPMIRKAMLAVRAANRPDF